MPKRRLPLFTRSFNACAGMLPLFTILRLPVAVLGITFLIAPSLMLGLLPKEDRERLMAGRTYRITAMLGGLLLTFICAPLSFAVGMLVAFH